MDDSKTTPQLESVSETKDLFQALGLQRRGYRLTEKQVHIEIHPAVTGALSMMGKAPDLVAPKVAVIITPDLGYEFGAKVEVEIPINAFEVVSSDISENDKRTIKRKLRTDLFHTNVFPLILFQVSAISFSADEHSVLVSGHLMIHGRNVEQAVLFKRTGSAFEASLKISQKAFSLTPLTALMGGLKAEDQVSVRCVVQLDVA